MRNRVKRIEREKKRKKVQEVGIEKEKKIKIIQRNKKIIKEKQLEREVKRDHSLDLEVLNDTKIIIQNKIKKHLIMFHKANNKENFSTKNLIK